VQNRAILCKIGQYLCRKSTAKIVLISDILLADKADSQPNKRELNFNCLQLQHSYVQSHPRLVQLDETAHRMQRVHLQYRISSNRSRVCNRRLVSANDVLIDVGGFYYRKYGMLLPNPTTDIRLQLGSPGRAWPTSSTACQLSVSQSVDCLNMS